MTHRSNDSTFGRDFKRHGYLGRDIEILKGEFMFGKLLQWLGLAKKQMIVVVLRSDSFTEEMLQDFKKKFEEARRLGQTPIMGIGREDEVSIHCVEYR